MVSLFESNIKSGDPTYVKLRNRDQLAKQRTLINELYHQFEPYADKNFSSHFPVKCLARFWEMFLGCSLINAGFGLVRRGARPGGGPDLCIRDGNSCIWIEAVVPSPGDGIDAVPPLTNGIVQEDKIVLRFSSAIRDKYLKYREYVNSGLISNREPFLIAVNGSNIPHCHDDPEVVPYAMQAVTPLGLPQVIFEPNTNRVIEEGFENRPRITKHSGSAVSTNIFLDDSFNLISGLLFSNAHPFYISSANLNTVSLLHNYSPINRLPDGWFGSRREWLIVKDESVHLKRKVVAPV